MAVMGQWIILGSNLAPDIDFFPSLKNFLIFVQYV